MHTRNAVLMALGLALAAPAVAEAGVGVGVSYGIGQDVANFGSATLGVQYRTLPSLDLHINNFWLQLYPLDLLNYLASEDIFIAGSGYINVVQQPVSGGLTGVVSPGFHLAVADAGTDVLVVLAGNSRVGVETGDTAHVGAYVVPALGVAILDDPALYAGGRVEMSVWF